MSNKAPVCQGSHASIAVKRVRNKNYGTVRLSECSHPRVCVLEYSTPPPPKSLYSYFISQDRGISWPTERSTQILRVLQSHGFGYLRVSFTSHHDQISLHNWPYAQPSPLPLSIFIFPLFLQVLASFTSCHVFVSSSI